MVQREGCGASRLKEDIESFGGEVEQIFVDAGVEVIGRVHGLVDSAFDDLKKLIDSAAERARAAQERAAEYVQQNPWKTAAALLLLSVAITAFGKKEKTGLSGCADEHI